MRCKPVHAVVQRRLWASLMGDRRLGLCGASGYPRGGGPRSCWPRDSISSTPGHCEEGSILILIFTGMCLGRGQEEGQAESPTPEGSGIRGAESSFANPKAK